MGGGGGSGGHYFPQSPSELQNLLKQSQQDTTRTLLESDVNRYLLTLLATLNERDADQTRKVLDDILACVDKIDVDKLMFGGSVSKHTYVDGMSDVDALVILDGDEHSTSTSKAILKRLHDELRTRLPPDLGWVRRGDMAVTVTTPQGLEFQLVPALRGGRVLRVPDPASGGWVDTDPKAFQKELTKQNGRLGGMLVPAIKLTKAVVGTLPDPKRIGGYHIEAMAVDAAREYSGPQTVKAVVTHVLKYAASRVLSPIQDVTGQSHAIDGALGPANSLKRRVVADALAAVGRKLDAASSVETWKDVFG